MEPNKWRESIYEVNQFIESEHSTDLKGKNNCHLGWF